MSEWAMIQWILLVLAAPAAGYFLLRWRQGRAQLAYCIVLIFGFIWAVGQHLENCIILYAPSEGAFRASLYLCYLGMCALGPACVYLAWCYAGKYHLYRDKGKVAALFGTGAFFFLIILTNDLHGLYYTRLSMNERVYSVLFYFFTMFSYVCFIYACFAMRQTRLGIGSRSVWLFLLSFGAPVAANTWGMICGDRTLDFTPLAYCIMVLGAYLIIWRHRPVNLHPIAAKTIFDSMKYPVRLRAPDGSSVYYNGAEPLAGHEYRIVESSPEDGNRLEIHTDVTEYSRLQKELESVRIQLETVRKHLAGQSELLARQAETAAQLAANQQRMKITSLLDREVRGKLVALHTHAESVFVAPEKVQFEEGKRLASEALELVRRIVHEVKRGPSDEL